MSRQQISMFQCHDCRVMTKVSKYVTEDVKCNVCQKVIHAATARIIDGVVVPFDGAKE